MNYNFSNAVPQDETWVNDLTRATMKPYVEKSWSTAEERENYYRLNRFNLQYTRIILVNGQKAGRLTASQNNKILTIENIHLLPEFHGSGLGTKVISDIIETALSKGLAVELKCLKTNPVSSLYERLGFKLKEQDEKRLYYRIEQTD